MQDRDEQVFEFIRQAGLQGPVTITERQVAEFLAEHDGGNNEQYLPEAQQAIMRLADQGKVSLHQEPDGTVSADYPKLIEPR